MITKTDWEGKEPSVQPSVEVDSLVWPAENMEANNNNIANNNNGANGGHDRDPLVNMRDRLFHTLFFRLSLAYAR